MPSAIYGKRLSLDPGRLEVVEERLELLARLKRKYGGSIEAVLKRQAEAEEELGRIASVDGEMEKLSEAIALERECLEKIGADLSARAACRGPGPQKRGRGGDPDPQDGKRQL